MRRRTLFEGLIIAVVVGLLTAYGSVLGSHVPQLTLFGAALGAILALVPHRSPLGRVGSFAVGFGAAWIGYAMRAGFLPGTNGGRAVAAIVAILIITAVTVATADRLPLWAGLVGTAAMTGAYEFTYTATPDLFTTESVVMATSVLLAAAVAFVGVILLPEPAAEPATETRADTTGEPGDRVGVDLFKTSKTSEA